MNLLQDREIFEEQLVQLDRRARVIEHDLRILNGIIRVKSLGRDRFWNRYWWYDGSLGSYPFECVSKNVELKPFAGQKSARIEEVFNEFTTGMIIVEYFGLSDEVECTDEQRVSVIRGEAVGKWGYYSTVTEVNLVFIQFDTLLRWLDPRGIRECALMHSCDRLYDFIVATIEAKVNNKDSTNEDYRNKWV